MREPHLIVEDAEVRFSALPNDNLHDIAAGQVIAFPTPDDPDFDVAFAVWWARYILLERYG